MKISRFFGVNSREVMRQVRQVLGPDALIVSNRSVDGGVEVLATVEGAFDDAASETPQREAAPYAPAPAAPVAPAAVPQTGYAAPSRSIAAYQSAFASSALPEEDTAPEDVAGATSAAAVPYPAALQPAPAQPAAIATRVELPALPPIRPTAPATSAPAAVSMPAPAAVPMPAAAAPMPPPAAVAPSMARTPDAPLRQTPAMPAAALPSDTAAGLQDAISALRGALETRMDGLLWGGRPGSGREPAAAALFRSLLDAGFSTKLVRALVDRLPQGMTADAAQSWARNELVTHLPVVASEDEFLAGGVYA
ncbi:MAG: flagellar biosynthesis protein FlhF, partial [Achromobacter sp.]